VKNVWVVAAIVTLDGLTASDTKTAGTVRVVDPLIPPEVAVIVVVPVFTPVAIPPAAIVALVGSEEFQVTDAVKSCVLPPL
jgi:hypothetical protein